MESKDESTNTSPFPMELWLTVAGMLRRQDVSTLMATCRFFYTDKAMNYLRGNLPKRALIAAGSNYSMLFTLDRQLLVWGGNEFGQLGLGDFDARTTFTACNIPLQQNEYLIELVANWQSLALTNTGRLLVCGHNQYGQLGLGDKQNRYTFTECPLTLQEGECIVQLAAGYSSSFILTSIGRLFVCGANTNGELGLGNQDVTLTFTACPVLLQEKERIIRLAEINEDIMYLITSSGRLLSTKENVFKEVSVSLQENEQIIQYCQGGTHSLFLTNRGRLFGLGSNFYGELGLGETDEINCFTEIEVGLRKNERIIQLFTGRWWYSLVLTSTGRVLGCGNNRSGQLGLGDDWNQSLIFTECPIPLQENEGIAQLAVRASHSYILTTTGRLLACGDCYYGGPGLVNNPLKLFTPCPLNDLQAQELASMEPLITETESQYYCILQ